MPFRQTFPAAGAGDPDTGSGVYDHKRLTVQP
jgi:hypothetical protein